MTKTFTYASFCAGIGGMTMGFEKVGGQGVLASEFDPEAKGKQFAQEAHKLLHPQIPVVGDLTKLTPDDLPYFDVAAYTPPCQSYSYAGERKGLDDMRGTVAFYILKLLQAPRPKIHVMENVKGLLTDDDGRTFETLVSALCSMGYVVDFTVIDSRDYGAPQKRERVYMVAIRDDLVAPEVWAVEGTTVLAETKRNLLKLPEIKTFNFDWNPIGPLQITTNDLLEADVPAKYFYSDERCVDIPVPSDAVNPLEPNMVGRLAIKAPDKCKRVYNPYSVITTITANSGGYHEPKIALGKGKARKLTPKETLRHQRVSDAYIDKLIDGGFSDSRLYKFAGNMITISVAERIAQSFVKYLDEEKGEA